MSAITKIFLSAVLMFSMSFIVCDCFAQQSELELVQMDTQKAYEQLQTEMGEADAQLQAADYDQGQQVQEDQDQALKDLERAAEDLDKEIADLEEQIRNEADQRIQQTGQEEAQSIEQIGVEADQEAQEVRAIEQRMKQEKINQE